MGVVKKDSSIYEKTPNPMVRMGTPKTAVQKQEKTSGPEKHWTVYLQKDSRVGAPPRHIEVLTEFGKAEKNKSSMVMLKVYALLHTPGSELMSIAWIDEKSGKEFEMAFDEKFPISLKFRTQTDSERVSWAKDQILKQGGKTKLVEIFKSLFPEFSV